LHSRLPHCAVDRKLPTTSLQQRLAQPGMQL
jgi:hypothetical protein